MIFLNAYFQSMRVDNHKVHIATYVISRIDNVLDVDIGCVYVSLEKIEILYSSHDRIENQLLHVQLSSTYSKVVFRRRRSEAAHWNW